MLNEIRLQESVDSVRNGLAMCACAMDAAIMNETEHADEILFAVKESLDSYIAVLGDVSEKLGNSGLASVCDENEA